MHRLNIQDIAYGDFVMDKQSVLQLQFSSRYQAKRELCLQAPNLRGKVKAYDLEF